MAQSLAAKRRKKNRFYCAYARGYYCRDLSSKTLGCDIDRGGKFSQSGTEARAAILRLTRIDVGTDVVKWMCQARHILSYNPNRFL